MRNQRLLTVEQIETRLSHFEAKVVEDGEFVRPVSVLLADDSEDDRFFIVRAINRSTFLRVIAEVQDGVELTHYLGGTNGYHDRQKYPLPDLLLLDLHMPKVSGREVLAWIAAQHLPNMRIVILTGSVDLEGIQQALALGADYYQLKPQGANTFVALIHRLELLMRLFNRQGH